MLKSSIEGGIFGEGPVAPARVRPTRDHDIFTPDHSPPVKPARRPASAIAKADAPRSTPLLGLGSLEWSGSAEFKPARPLKMKLDPSTMEVAGIFKPAEVERPVTPRSAASNTSSVEGGIFSGDYTPPPEPVMEQRAPSDADFGTVWARASRNDLLAMLDCARDVLHSATTPTAVIEFPLILDHEVLPRNNTGAGAVSDRRCALKEGARWIELARRLRASPTLQRVFATLVRTKFDIEVTFTHG